MASALEGKLVISILAGSTISQLQACVPSSTRVVRAMPNTPCKVRHRAVALHALNRTIDSSPLARQIREGMTVLSTLPASHPSTPLTRQILLSIFTPIGRCRFLDEKHFDACTALSGSGPAFACLMLEAMADGGVMMGLPRGEALELAAQSGCFLKSPGRYFWFVLTLDSIALCYQPCKGPRGWSFNPVLIQHRSRTA